VEHRQTFHVECTSTKTSTRTSSKPLLKLAGARWLLGIVSGLAIVEGLLLVWGTH
jgi:hypothetical protein